MSFTESIDELVAKSPDGRVTIHPSWSRVKLSQVAKILNGFPFASDNFNNEKGFPLIRIRDIVRGKTETFYFGDFDKEFVVERGDLLVGMDGDFNCALWKGEPALLNQRVCKLIPDEGKFDKRFLEYALPGYLGLINRHTPSLTVKHLSSGTIKDIPLPFPPVEIQQAIAGKIEELFSDLDAGVAALKRAQANLKRYRAAVLKAAVEGRLTEQWRAERKAKGVATEPAAELLARILAERRKKWEAAQLKKYADSGKAPPKGWQNKYPEPAAQDTSGLPELPGGWCWATMNQLSERFEYGTSVKCGYETAYEPVLRIPNIVRGDIDLSDLKFSTQALSLDETDALQVGDMLICRTNGSISLIGKTALVKTRLDKNYSFASYLLRFRFVLNETLPAWVNLYMISFQGRKFIESNAASSAGQHNISLGLLSKMLLPLPSLPEQTEIVTQVEAKLSNIAQAETEIKRSLERAARLRQAILKRAFEGRLV